MPKSPLDVLEKMDPELIKLVKDSRTLAITDGVLSKKVKLLIAVALDAAHGTESGVRVAWLHRQCRQGPPRKS